MNQTRKPSEPVSTRVARHRAKQRAAGMASLSLVVPAKDVEMFKALASERRERFNKAGSGAEQEEKHPNQSVYDYETPAEDRKNHSSRAEMVAKQLLQKVVAMGWPVGMPLGTEAELMQSYQVSRTVLRQTIRLLQQLSIAKMQRGAQGGLVVTRPELAATVQAVDVMLEYMGIKSEDISETRKLLEYATVARAVERLTPLGEERLISVIEAERDMDGNTPPQELQRFHVTVGELSGDPALTLFIRIILRITDAHSTFSQRPFSERDAVVKRIKKYHRKITENIISRRTKPAVETMEAYIDGLKTWMK